MQIKRIIVGLLKTNCYLLISKHELGIIDPGGEAEKILKEIRKIGKPVKYIINTHYHPDHTLANQKISKETGAKILIHESENKIIAIATNEFWEAGEPLKDGDEIKIANTVLRVLHTPGHSKGSICLLGKNFVFTGDTLFKNGYGRTDLAGGSQKEIEKSLKKLSRLLKPGATIYPGHGEIFLETKKSPAKAGLFSKSF